MATWQELYPSNYDSDGNFVQNGGATNADESWNDGYDNSTEYYSSGGSSSDSTSSDSTSSDSTSSDSTSSGNPTQEQLKEYHSTWGDTTTSFEDAAGPSYEEQIASEIISSGGSSLDYLEQNITSLPNTTLDGVKAEFQNMVGSSATNEPATNEPATNEPAVPSILPENWPSLFDGQGQGQTDSGSGLLVAGVLAVGVVLSVLGGR